ncbi:MAG TPA: FecR family protein [Hanamia sp.]|nr:FecR family protein [Hanamia sp.]
MQSMDYPNDRLKDLIEKYIANTCTRKELDQLLFIMENEKETESLSQILKDYWEKSGKESHLKESELDLKFALLIEEAKHEAPVVSIVSGKRKRTWNIQYAAAAVIFCMLSVSVYFLFKPKEESQISKTENIHSEKNDVVPGKNKAILTLANGSSIILDSAANGTLTTQGNSKILKLNGMLSYNTLKNKSSEVVYNTISTPRGGQYQLMLADGSKVWLNAASSLRFPASFVGKERKVELLGEAYFEVAKNAKMPFKVKVNGMEVEVLGTHFNINSYENESTIRTTLLEGSVKINKNNSSSLLKPGQQAQMNKAGEIKIINDADVEEAIAWKEGKFQFDRADIHDIMRQLTRWYDVNVEYKGTVSSHFGGTISRDVNLSQVLNMLHLTGEVKFQVEDRKVVVMP